MLPDERRVYPVYDRTEVVPRALMAVSPLQDLACNLGDIQRRSGSVGKRYPKKWSVAVECLMYDPLVEIERALGA